MSKTLFQKARAVSRLLGNRERWTTGKLAKNADGFYVEPCDPAACKFCLIGAVAHVEGFRADDKTDFDDLYERVAHSELGHLLRNVILGIKRDFASVRERPGAGTDAWTLYDFNDGRPYEEVMEVVNTAVAFARVPGEVR